MKNNYKMPAALWALTISAFAIGTTEFVMVGILPTVARSFQVSVSTAGLQVTLYALGVAIGGPLLTALTGSVPRKPLLLYLMLLFIAGHLASALANSFALLLITRFISGFAHGVFFGVGATIAATLVPSDKKATAIAIMFAGFTIAIVAGVPLGTYIGQRFGWRFTLGGVALLGFIGLIANWLLLPGDIENGPVLRMKDQLKVLLNGHILLVLAITAFGYGGTFVTFTYMATILEQITGFSPGAISLLLLLYGLAVAIGNVIGGKVSNRNPIRSLIVIFALQALILLVFSFTADHQVPAIITLFFMGILAYASVPGLQLYIVQLSSKYLPGTENVSSALNIAAFNVGVAIGATVGGIVVQSRLGLPATPWISSLFVLLGLGLSVWSFQLEKEGASELVGLS
ncbi:MFS transporter [Mucilaginibacter sp. X4EP1]|uniref:MFS transporter n=1 Tax=Mucilaginibacter sp. X4EP1 TaxID=2723092 RepID=UPI0021689A06|nr:MFS transporter [Mucilaginibacter sp. X4EP1]MCS3811526.1 putative MFS family arabinose efflux permease [Mucilaginibacter sp. X4EP1]